MKIAVINFSGNVGKTTIARHLLLPRIPGAELIAVETKKAREAEGLVVLGRKYGALQNYLYTVENAVIDVGASNVDDWLNLMRVYRGSHAEFDCFIVPTTPDVKHQQDTIATLVDLSQLGVSPARLKLLFNMAEFGASIKDTFDLVCPFLEQHPICPIEPACSLRVNDIYGRLRQMDPTPTIATLAADQTNYKPLIAAATDPHEKLLLGHRLSTQRLAEHVTDELDACFAALKLAGQATAAAATTPDAPAGRAAPRRGSA